MIFQTTSSCNSLYLCFQNAMRATNELHEGSKEGLPLIKSKVTLGKEDLSVKVSFLCKHSCVACLDPNLPVFSS